MLSKKKDTTQSSMFFGLEDMLNQKHPMYILANKVNWQLFTYSGDMHPVIPVICTQFGG